MRNPLRLTSDRKPVLPSPARPLGPAVATLALGGCGLLFSAGLVWLACPPAAPAARPLPPLPRPAVARVTEILPDGDPAAARGEECPGEMPPFPRIAGNDPAADVIAALGTEGYARAARRAADLADSEDRLQCLLPIIAGWVEMQPLEAARFAQSLPAGGERAEVLAAAIAGWAGRDPAAAGAWLDHLAPEADQDGAFAAMATATLRQPAAALGWAGRISDAGRRWETTRTVMQNWALADDAAARLQLQRMPGLADGQRAQLFKRIDQCTALLD